MLLIVDLTVVRADICHLSHMAFGKVSETEAERWILLFPRRDDSVRRFASLTAIFVGMSKMLLSFLQVAHSGGLVSAQLSFPTDFFSRHTRTGTYRSF